MEQYEKSKDDAQFESLTQFDKGQSMIQTQSGDADGMDIIELAEDKLKLEMDQTPSPPDAMPEKEEDELESGAPHSLVQADMSILNEMN